MIGFFTTIGAVVRRNVTGLGHATRMFLTVLGLSSTGVTDTGLKELASLHHLEHLTVTLTKVTPEGVDQLQKTLPKCKIVK